MKLQRWVLAAAFLAAGVAPADDHSEVPFLQVRTEGGVVQGARDSGLLVYKGIPYVRAPVGDLRWRAPQPVESWIGVRDATRLAPDCMQAPLGPPPSGGRHTISEDCLYLNIWRPAHTSGKTPVMVWIHGGGFVNGGSSSRDSSGEGVAGRGVLFVSFNYRLGRFGFFGFPALSREHPNEPKGNYGLMDQIAALQWIRRNIDDFGGDPDKVTVVGESAGGISINMLLTSPAEKGLFDRAIIQSGGGRKLVRTRRLIEDLPDAASATTLGVRFASKQKIVGEDESALRALRALSAEQITSGLNMMSLLARDASLFAGPVIDGKLFVETPEQAYAAGRQQRVPIIIGATSSDLGLNMARSVDEAFAAFGADAKAARAAYDPSGLGDLKMVNNAIGADRAMIEPSRFIARSMSGLDAPAYEYRFSYVLEAKRAESPWGAQHASDVPFAFDLLEAMHGSIVTANDRRMADAMADYWTNFARTGDPNGAGLTRWPAYEEAEDVLLDFGADGNIKAGRDPWRDRLDLTEKAHRAR